MTQKGLALICSDNVTDTYAHTFQLIWTTFFSVTHFKELTKQCNEALWLSYLSGRPSGSNALRVFIRAALPHQFSLTLSQPPGNANTQTCV